MIAEFLGSLLLAAIVVGSGIAAQTLSPGDVGLQLFENAIATAFGLFAIILIFGPVSGAHFNPVVSLVDSALGQRPWSQTLAYIPVQVAGCITGAVAANLMFDAPPVSWSETDRLTGAHFLSEIVATAGLVLVIFSLVRSGRAQFAPAAVGAYIGAAYFFTSSTSFANPAITVGRMFSDSFAGIAPGSAPGYIAAQLLGGAVGWFFVLLLYPSDSAATLSAARQDAATASSALAPARVDRESTVPPIPGRESTLPPGRESGLQLTPDRDGA
ncbi:MIP/aquaporin family protein [Marisediminicola sp. UYEF4]|uniref:MIP/aquaporin family protein n=1 Tax=Marisediminicola sp. UYEF4 TaxID=1756384 RepID=UPI00339848FC